MKPRLRLTTASIKDLRQALEAGQTTSLALTAAYLRRIAAYDLAGPRLNAIPVLNPAMFEEARASDLRRAAGQSLGPLDGIPYTAKNSYKVKGLTVAAGSPAFRDLVATEDAFAIERLRAAGAVLIGLTNMPPMANGGMQRGLYGRAESPWNGDYLTAAFASGSSNGSGSATSAGFAAFGLGEETWSSGRAPAANNALCAYTPSRGVISVRGNWPLVPTMDVVVPHTRSMADMFEVLDVIVADDTRTRGDLWRMQDWVPIPLASEVRPASYQALAGGSLAGKRFGLPAMYINQDSQAGTGEAPGIGGPTGQRIETRPSMLALVNAAVARLREAGAEVVVTDFPLVSNYEGDRAGAPKIQTRGLVSPDYLRREIVDLSVWAWDDFLAANGDPALNRLAQVDGAQIFPQPAGALPDRYTGFGDDIADYPAHARAHPVTDFRAIPHLEEGFQGLEETRKRDLEDWMAALGLDAVIFPALADIGPADADVNPASADLAWRNGTWVANGNLAVRHLGVPTVTVPMGIMADIGMPGGLTFAGRAWDDSALLALAAGFEALTPPSGPPPRVPELPTPPALPGQCTKLSLQLSDTDGTRLLIETDAPEIRLCANGVPLATSPVPGGFAASLPDSLPDSHPAATARLIIAEAPGQAAWLALG
ncbi:amidase [Xinfangfangia sp. D13-10-4-6]|uniref:amidase n=1 Tax=Pseudogemmobacter hezensis TaxID=2737662 RepID=UPI001555ED86|nr:amidase [Pseudogemmobacter hezensis]NPD16291.1 amidase [Pseudogemmobacter hezensis]